MARHRGGGKKIDTVHWTGFVAEALAVGVAGTTAVTLFAAQHLPETLLRIRGEWAAALISTLPPGTGARVTAGIVQVPEGTGTTVLWSPETDADAPWIWWDVANLMYNEYSADATWSSQVSDRARVIDSKAMRKLRNTELQLVVENQDPGAITGTAVDVLVAGRALFGS